MTNQETERSIINLIAADRFDIPVSSIDGKLKRMRPKLASLVDLSGKKNFSGERVYAFVKDEEGRKARGMKDAIALFEMQYPKYGEILRGMIAEERVTKEPTMYFGMNPGCRLTADDYLTVMEKLGFTEIQARTLYQPLIGTSRIMSRKRLEERSILIG